MTNTINILVFLFQLTWSGYALPPDTCGPPTDPSRPGWGVVLRVLCAMRRLCSSGRDAVTVSDVLMHTTEPSAGTCFPS